MSLTRRNPEHIPEKRREIEVPGAGIAGVWSMCSVVASVADWQLGRLRGDR